MIPLCPLCQKPKFPAPSSHLKQRGLVCVCKSQPSQLEALFLQAWRESGGPEPERQQKPIPGRRFRTDFSWKAARIIVEVDGAVHRTKQRFHSDVEKSNYLQRDGWRVYRITGRMIRNETALKDFIGMIIQEIHRS